MDDGVDAEPLDDAGPQRQGKPSGGVEAWMLGTDADGERELTPTSPAAGRAGSVIDLSGPRSTGRRCRRRRRHQSFEEVHPFGLPMKPATNRFRAGR